MTLVLKEPANFKWDLFLFGQKETVDLWPFTKTSEVDASAKILTQFWHKKSSPIIDENEQICSSYDNFNSLEISFRWILNELSCKKNGLSVFQKNINILSFFWNVENAEISSFCDKNFKNVEFLKKKIKN